MFRLFFGVTFVAVVLAWVLAKLSSAPGRWPDERPNSKLEWDAEMDPANHSDEFDFSELGVVLAMVLLFLLLMPNAVTSHGQSIFLQDVSESKDMGKLTTFLSAWRAEDSLQFWSFCAGLLVTVNRLFRRSPALWGVAVIASLFALWLKMSF